MSQETNIRRYGVISYGVRESKDGSYLAVEDILAFLRNLTDEDDKEVMIGKIDALKEQLS